MMAQIRVMGISGSYGDDSSNSRLVRLGLKECEEAGAEVVFWSLVDRPLPLVGAEGSWEDETVKEFQKLVKSSDALLLSSPEYHGSFSGVMKNQLDWIYGDFVAGKVCAVMSTLGGVSNSNTLNHLRLVIRQLHMHCIPQQLAIAHIKEAFNDSGNLVDEKLQQRLSTLCKELVKITIILGD
jgi:FMN reductase